MNQRQGKVDFVFFFKKNLKILTILIDYCYYYFNLIAVPFLLFPLSLCHCILLWGTIQLLKFEILFCFVLFFLFFFFFLGS